MGLLDLALGKTSPVSQFVDANKFAIHGAFSGLGSGQNISQGLSNAAQGAAAGGQQDSAYGLTLRDQQSRLDQIQRENTIQDNALKLQAQGANATADYLDQSPNPQVRALAAAVRNRTISGADALNMILKPGQTVNPGDSVLVNPMGYNVGAPASTSAGTSDPNAPPPQPTQPTQTAGQAALIQAGFTPALSASGPNTDTSSFYNNVNGSSAPAASTAGATAPSPVAATVPVPQTATSVLPGSQDGSGRLSFVPAPTPAPPAAPAAVGAPMAAPAQASPGIPAAPQVAFTAPTADPSKMSVDQRKAAASAQGLQPGTPAYASFVLTGRVPVGAMETWRAPTKEELAAKGISSADAGVYQINSATQELRPVAGAMSSDSVGANAPTVGLGPDGHPDPTQQAAFFAALPPSTAAEVKGIVNYQLDLSKVTSLKGNQRQQMVQLATQADPTFDMTQYPARQAMKKSVTSGTISQNILAANTAIQHLSELNDSVDKLGNTANPMLNAGKNFLSLQSGHSEVSTFQQTATAAKDELAKLFKGAGATDIGSLKDWGQGLDVNSSPDQLHATIQNAIANLLKARLDTIESQYQQVMGKPADFQILKPPAIAALKKLGIDPSSIDPNAAPPPANNSNAGPSDAAVQALLQKYGT